MEVSVPHRPWRTERKASLRRLRLLAIAMPLSALTLLEYLREGILSSRLQSVPSILVLAAILAAGVSFFSFTVFGLIERLERRILDQNAQLTALNEIATASSENLELNDLLDRSLDKVLQAMRTDAGIICLLDTETAELLAACHRGFSDELARRMHRQPLGMDPMATRVATTGCPVVAERMLDNPETAELARREGFRSAVSVALKSEGEVCGVLGVVTRSERRFTAGELDLLNGIGGQLGLAVRNATLFAKARQRNEDLGALLEVGRAATSSLDLQSMLDRSLDAILAVTSAEAAEVWLGTQGGDLVLERRRGAWTVGSRQGSRLKLGEGLPGLAIRRGSPVTVQDLADARVPRRAAKSEMQIFCAAPLCHRGSTLGVLAVAARDRPEVCSRSELRLLEGISERVAIAIENARLHEQVLDVAVLEERERISRELHDGLAQVLGYIHTQALAIHKYLDSGKSREAKTAVLALDRAARDLYTDVREAILGLRVPLAGGFVPAVQTFVERFREMTGVSVEVKASDAARALKLPASAEIQLLRIVQEALSNVRKHAKAARARLIVDATPRCMSIAVVDDGQGFDPDRPVRTGWPHFGLQTMRERAEAVGGDFDVRSMPGRGTRVGVQVPLARQAEAKDASAARR